MTVTMHHHRDAIRALPILAALAERPYSAPELEDVLSFSKVTIRKIVRRLQREGFAEPAPSSDYKDWGSSTNADAPALARRLARLARQALCLR
jgi:DNA-binding IclR family transcriptional regulator